MSHNEQVWEKYPVTIFVLDDQRSFTNSLKKSLSDTPFLHLHTCNQPEDALEQILNIGPTVILLDIHMPIIDGFSILKQLKADEATKHIPALILSVDTDHATRKKAYESGALDYLIKTPDIDELVVKLRHHTRAYIDHLEHDAMQASLVDARNRLKELSPTDPLTNVGNRCSFETLFIQEWQRALRETIALSLIFVDIDRFRHYNSFYGRMVGDDCLKEVAIALKNQLQRPSDFIGRYENDQFVILLPNTHSQGAMLLAEQLRKGIQSLNLEHQDSDLSDFVSISLGVATTSPMVKHKTFDFLNTAEEALREAKSLGMNMVISKSL